MNLILDFQFDIGPYVLIAVAVLAVSAIVCTAIIHGSRGYLYGEEEVEEVETPAERITKRYE